MLPILAQHSGAPRCITLGVRWIIPWHVCSVIYRCWSWSWLEKRMDLSPLHVELQGIPVGPVKSLPLTWLLPLRVLPTILQLEAFHSGGFVSLERSVDLWGCWVNVWHLSPLQYMFNIYERTLSCLVLLHGGFGGIEYGSLAQLVKPMTFCPLTNRPHRPYHTHKSHPQPISYENFSTWYKPNMIMLSTFQYPNDHPPTSF